MFSPLICEITNLLKQITFINFHFIHFIDFIYFNNLPTFTVHYL